MRVEHALDSLVSLVWSKSHDNAGSSLFRKTAFWSMTSAPVAKDVVQSDEPLTVFIDGPTRFTYVWSRDGGWKFIGTLSDRKSLGGRYRCQGMVAPRKIAPTRRSRDVARMCFAGLLTIAASSQGGEDVTERETRLCAEATIANA